jgi:hypothetical protein
MDLDWGGRAVVTFTKPSAEERREKEREKGRELRVEFDCGEVIVR